MNLFVEIDLAVIFFSVFLCTPLMINLTLNARVALGALVCACVFIVATSHFWLPFTAALGYLTVIIGCIRLYSLCEKGIPC